MFAQFSSYCWIWNIHISLGLSQFPSLSFSRGKCPYMNMHICTDALWSINNLTLILLGRVKLLSGNFILLLVCSGEISTCLLFWRCNWKWEEISQSEQNSNLKLAMHWLNGKKIPPLNKVDEGDSFLQGQVLYSDRGTLLTAAIYCQKFSSMFLRKKSIKQSNSVDWGWPHANKNVSVSAESAKFQSVYTQLYTDINRRHFTLPAALITTLKCTISLYFLSW